MIEVTKTKLDGHLLISGMGSFRIHKRMRHYIYGVVHRGWCDKDESFLATEDKILSIMSRFIMEEV
jgi:hypothetical protein